MGRIISVIIVVLSNIVASYAQENIYFAGKNGTVSVEFDSQIDSLTFSLPPILFKISKPVNLGATTNSFQCSVQVSLNESVSSLNVDNEVGICYSAEKNEPTYSDNRQFLDTLSKVWGDGFVYGLESNNFTIEGVSSGVTYYYRAYVKILDQIFYGPVASISMLGEKKSNDKNYVIINGHRFVDLGLPSGLLWAETNVGAETILDKGDYFSWGETEPKNYYTYACYKWKNVDSDSYHQSYLKYNKSDGKVTLDQEDDAATVTWGKGCRIPSFSEIQELVEKCTWSYAGNEEKKLYGMLVTGPNRMQIFLPCSDSRYLSGTCIEGDSFGTGCYWSCSLNSDYKKVLPLFFLDGEVDLSYSCGFRYLGSLVRAVSER